MFLNFWFLGPGDADLKPKWTENELLGHSREGINNQIYLKSFTHIAWVDPWGSLFIFWKFCFLDPGDPVLDPKWTENIRGAQGKAWMVKSVCNLLHVEVGWITGGFVFIFWKFWFLGPRDPKWTSGHSKKGIDGQIFQHFVYTALLNGGLNRIIFRDLVFGFCCWFLVYLKLTLNSPFFRASSYAPFAVLNISSLDKFFDSLSWMEFGICLMTFGGCFDKLWM